MYLRSWCGRDFLKWVCISMLFFIDFECKEAGFFSVLSFIFFSLFCCSQSSRLPRSAGGMGYWAVVSIHIYEHAAMGKWSGFMLYLFNYYYLFFWRIVHLNISDILVVQYLAVLLTPAHILIFNYVVIP